MHTHTSPAPPLYSLHSGTAPSKGVLVALLAFRALLFVLGIVAVSIPKMSSVDGIDYGLYKSRVNGVLVECVANARAQADSKRLPP